MVPKAHSSTIVLHGFQNFSSVFTKGGGRNLIILLVYVDDIMVVDLNMEFIKKTQALLQSHIKLQVEGNLKYFLVLEIASSSKGIHL